MKHTLAALCASFCASLALAQGLPEANGEPANDSAATAETAMCGAQHYGTIDFVGDYDAWAFDVTAPDQQVTIWTSGRGELAIDDTLIAVYDSTFNLLAVNDDESPHVPGHMSLLSVNLEPGPYYLVVQGVDGDFGTYAFDIACDPKAAPLTPAAESEPNDDVPSATPIAIGSEYAGSISGIGDTDYFALALAAPTHVILEAHACTHTLGFPADTVMFLHQTTTGELLAADDDSGYDLSARIETTLDPGTYHVEVTGFDGILSGDYCLTVETSTACAEQQLTPLIPVGSDPCAGLGGDFNELVVPAADWGLRGCGGGLDPSVQVISLPDCETDLAFFLPNAISSVDYVVVNVPVPMWITLETRPHPWRYPSATRQWIKVEYALGCPTIQIASFLPGSGASRDHARGRVYFPAAGQYYIAVGSFDANFDPGWVVLEMHQEAPTFASGCNQTGDQLELRPRVGERPRLGGSHCTTDIRGVPASMFGEVMLVGVEQTTVFDLGIVGAPGCRLGHVVLVSDPLTLTTSGWAEYGIEFGFIPGATFYLQAAAIAFGSNGLNVILSNRLEWTIGNEPETRTPISSSKAKK